MLNSVEVTTADRTTGQLGLVDGIALDGEWAVGVVRDGEWATTDQDSDLALTLEREMPWQNRSLNLRPLFLPSSSKRIP